MAEARTLEERFFDAYVVDPTSGCWIWAGARSWKQYGFFRLDGKSRKASHISLELDGRPRPEGALALHSCDNPPCVNPMHLRWGTQKDNIAESMSKGRFTGLQNLKLGHALGMVHATAASTAARLAKTHCKRGHERNEINSAIRANGVRECRICRRLLDNKRRAA